MRVVQLAGHLADQCIELLIPFGCFHQRRVSTMHFVPIDSVVRRIVVMVVDLFPNFLEYFFAVLWSEAVLDRGCGRRTTNLRASWSFRTFLGKRGATDCEKQQKAKQRAGS